MCEHEYMNMCSPNYQSSAAPAFNGHIFLQSYKISTFAIFNKAFEGKDDYT